MSSHNLHRRSILALAAGAAVLMSSVPSLATNNVCSDIFSGVTKIVKTIQQEPLRVYPKGVDPKTDPTGNFQVAYESEYLFNESAALLRDYAPDGRVVKLKVWEAMTDEQRVNWLKSKFQNKPEYASAAGLKKKVNIPFMPKELIIDSTGNLEIVLDKFESEEEWSRAVDIIVERYGVGSQQAMISKPRIAAFPNGTTAKVQSSIEDHLGWQIYTQLSDMYAKLESGFERYKKDPTKPTALSFDHPFLGPMNKIKRDVMEDYMRQNATGGKYDDASKQFVRKSDASFKYTGGPSYRPDIAGPDRFAWELRNAHKDLADLKMKVHRDLVAHANGLEGYKLFSQVPAFDSIAEFDRLPGDVQNTLRTLFPSKADPRFEYDEPSKRSLETYRNFSLPMQDMARLTYALQGLRSTELLTQVKKAQQNYLGKLKTVATDLQAAKITAPIAKAKIMGALGEFANESGLQAAFTKKAVELGHEGGTFNPAQTKRDQAAAVKAVAVDAPKAAGF